MKVTQALSCLFILSFIYACGPDPSKDDKGSNEDAPPSDSLNAETPAEEGTDAPAADTPPPATDKPAADWGQTGEPGAEPSSPSAAERLLVEIVQGGGEFSGTSNGESFHSFGALVIKDVYMGTPYTTVSIFEEANTVSMKKGMCYSRMWVGGLKGRQISFSESGSSLNGCIPVGFASTHCESNRNGNEVTLSIVKDAAGSKAQVTATLKIPAKDTDLTGSFEAQYLDCTAGL